MFSPRLELCNLKLEEKNATLKGNWTSTIDSCRGYSEATGLQQLIRAEVTLTQKVLWSKLRSADEVTAFFMSKVDKIR